MTVLVHSAEPPGTVRARQGLDIPDRACERLAGREGRRRRARRPRARAPALARLSPRQREVIELVKFQGLAVSEAARRMGKTPGSTSVLLYNALRRLVALLDLMES